MKTYNNFNEMYNENSNTNRSVFNKMKEVDWEGYDEWKIYPNKPIPSVHTNHGAIITVWSPQSDLTKEEKVTFGMIEPEENNGISVFLCLDEGDCANVNQLFGLLKEAVNSFVPAYSRCITDVLYEEYEDPRGIHLTVPTKYANLMYGIAKDLADYLDGDVAIQIADSIQGFDD